MTAPDRQSKHSTLVIVGIILLFVLALCTGCSTPVPIRPQFPPVPEALMERCPQLKTIAPDNTDVREFLKTVIENYAYYYQCSEKTHTWQDWYRESKKIYEDVGR